AEEALDEVGITCNKNTIPFDEESPFVTSGIRLGTPAMTTRGFIEEDMREVADLMAEVLTAVKNGQEFAELKDRVSALTGKYPLYQYEGCRNKITYSGSIEKTGGTLCPKCKYWTTR